ncbi:hypothetical protein [Alistipes finegoldii]|uniref:hypothetical protein n=1 Tax=Alistipes finegoldii TaxID=214856 RepID=UPI0040271ADA
MNKILLFLLGGCIIGSAITIFSAQNKHKKIPTQQNAESKQNTQQEDRISTISPNILLGFHLGMSKLEYNSLIKQVAKCRYGITTHIACIGLKPRT